MSTDELREVLGRAFLLALHDDLDRTGSGPSARTARSAAAWITIPDLSSAALRPKSRPSASVGVNGDSSNRPDRAAGCTSWCAYSRTVGRSAGPERCRRRPGARPRSPAGRPRPPRRAGCRGSAPRSRGRWPGRSPRSRSTGSQPAGRARRITRGMSSWMRLRSWSVSMARQATAFALRREPLHPPPGPFVGVAGIEEAVVEPERATLPELDACPGSAGIRPSGVAGDRSVRESGRDLLHPLIELVAISQDRALG